MLQIKNLLNNNIVAIYDYMYVATINKYKVTLLTKEGNLFEMYCITEEYIIDAVKILSKENNINFDFIKDKVLYKNNNYV